MTDQPVASRHSIGIAEPYLRQKKTILMIGLM